MLPLILRHLALFHIAPVICTQRRKHFPLSLPQVGAENLDSLARRCAAQLHRRLALRDNDYQAGGALLPRTLQLFTTRRNDYEADEFIMHSCSTCLRCMTCLYRIQVKATMQSKAAVDLREELDVLI
jgi:hypothetical protein